MRLGKLPKSQAAEIKIHIEHLLASRASDESVSPVLKAWLARISNQLREKLIKLELLEGNQRPADLAGLLQYGVGEYDHKNVNTKRIISTARDFLIEFFGASVSAEKITPGDADDFRRWLEGRGFAPSTIATICRRSTRLFNMAIRKEWISSNPFAGMGGYEHTNVERRFFVDRKSIEAIIDECEQEWKLWIALMRYGGLRSPSELIPMKWEHFDLENRSLKVFSPKTGERILPIFPEIWRHLLKAKAASSETHVLTIKRSERALYSGFLKRVKRVGIEPWPKLLLNLRSSCETDLVEQYPIHVVTAWLGHSPAIAKKHYLQVLDDHFQRAVNDENQPNGRNGKRA